MLNRKIDISFKRKASELRLLVVQAVKSAGKGHIGGSFSMMDVLTVLFYGGFLKIDLYRLKPFPFENLVAELQGCSKVVTVEEGFSSGGMGSVFGTAMLENGLKPDLLRIGIDDKFCYEYSDREFLKSKFGLDTKAIGEKVIRWLN